MVESVALNRYLKNHTAKALQDRKDALDRRMRGMSIRERWFIWTKFNRGFSDIALFRQIDQRKDER